MFNDFDAILKNLIVSGLSNGLNEKNILFVTPDVGFKPELPAINCFLYDIRENSELRSNEWFVDKNADGTVSKKRAPLWLDCSYIITTWATTIESEHRLLGEVFATLLSYEVKAGDSSNHSVNNRSGKTFLKFNKNMENNIYDMWNSLGIKPRSMLSYTLTASIEKQAPENIMLVKEKVINMNVIKEMAL